MRRAQPAYLGSQGLAARGLLTGTGEDDATSSALAVQSISSADGNNGGVLEEVSAWAADCVEGLGHAVVRLGRWMRGKVSGQQEAKEDGISSTAGASGGEDGAFLRRVGGGAIAVVAAMVAIVAVILLKKRGR